MDSWPAPPRLPSRVAGRLPGAPDAAVPKAPSEASHSGGALRDRSFEQPRVLGAVQQPHEGPRAVPTEIGRGMLGKLTKVPRTPILAAFFGRSPRGLREASSKDADDRFSLAFHTKIVNIFVSKIDVQKTSFYRIS